MQSQESHRLAALVDALQQRVNRADARISELSERILVLQAASGNPSPSSIAPPTLSVTPPSASLAPAASPALHAYEPRPVEPPRPVTSLARGSDLFHRALKAYQDGKASRAYEDFASFVRTYPDHPDADSALYWMGQCKFDAASYKDAIEQYTTLANQYPRSGKAAEALFKAGVAFEKLQQSDRAHAMFARLIAAYPHTASAELARSREHVSEDVHAP